jgi:cytoskeleton protein RodZ
MPDIGATLREARMRARIDISEIEAETKIRAKYLRALENEEWDLLPGPTYVKTFLRTYANALGLDAKLLVEEYRLRHERLSEQELMPISPRTARAARERRPTPSRFGRAWLVGGVVVALLGALYLLGRGNSSSDNSPPATAVHTTPRPATPATSTTGGATSTPKTKAAKPALVRLQLVPTGPVNVCLLDASGKRLINSVTLSPGAKQPTFKSKTFRMTFGNGAIAMRINGKLRQVPEVAAGIGYVVTRNGRRTLDATKRPTCA